MWKCKECGKDEFLERYTSGYKIYDRYDKEGKPIHDTLLDDYPGTTIECNNCGIKGEHLKDIADWEK